MPIDVANRISRSLPYLTVAGLAGVATNCLLGFEERNPAFLAGSCLALLAAPAAIIVHLALTRDLTNDEKRAWLRALHGRRAMWAWPAYLTASNRAAIARDLAEVERKPSK